MSSPDDVLAGWRAAALEDEGPALEALGHAALEPRHDDAQALRALSVAGALVERSSPLPRDARERALALARRGLGAANPGATRWDAAHVAAELALTALTPELKALLAEADASASLRGRAAEAFAGLAPAAEARARLEPLRHNDPDWAVRRLAGEALRLLEARRAPERGDLFARFKALVRTGRVRVEGGSAPLPAQQVAELGLRLPAAYRLFLASACAGGRLTLADEGPDGALRDVASLTLTPPAALRAELEAGGPRPDELRRIQEYVWARYVEGERGGAPLDEDRALRVLGGRYERGVVDADVWNYGVLLFEAAFRDEASRARHLVRAVGVLAAYRELEREPWDVVDDRLEEARALVDDERLREQLTPLERADGLLVLGRWDGALPLAIDLERPGVYQLDPDDPRGRVAGAVAPTLVQLLNDPLGHGPREPAAQAAPAPPTTTRARARGAPPSKRAPDGAAGPVAAPAAGRFTAAIEHLAAGQHRQAGRAFADTLEAGVTPEALVEAAALLCRPELGPLQAAQLLATVLMAGDKKTTETARDVLQALPGARARDLLDAVAPYDEDGSQVALLVDAAAGLRRKSHAEAKEAAKRMKASRSKAHVRTAKNPFYK